MRSTKKAARLAKYQQCWAAVHRGDLTELLELAADPTLTLEMLATIAPSNGDRDADVGLVGRILDHPACNEAVASRYTTHHDPNIRLRIVTFPHATAASLQILAIDRDERVREAATEQLRILKRDRATRGWP